MVASQIRAEAREVLRGKWGKAGLIFLSYVLVFFAISVVSGILTRMFVPIFVLDIALFVITLPIVYGLIVQFIHLKREGDVTYFDFFKQGFGSFSRVWQIYGNILLKMLPGIIIAIICAIVFIFSSVVGIVSSSLAIMSYHVSASFGIYSILSMVSFIGLIGSSIYLIPKTLLYILSYYVFFDHPELTNKEIVEKSAQLMIGNRCSFIWLILTFLGWSILSAFTFGIGLIFLFPYIITSHIIFYESLSGSKSDFVDVIDSSSSSQEDNPIQE